MTTLPTGTVTFLFTDVEGSTQLLTELGSDYAALLVRQHAILADQIAAHGGIRMGSEGDAVFAVFEQATAAVAAAVEAQRALHAEEWPYAATVGVRMGLLTGEGVPVGEGYVGIDVHRAARMAASGHGGQVLISESTRALVDRMLPAGVGLRDLGAHRLKDLAQPELIFELVIDGLPADFPPLRSSGARPNNLPLPLTSFIGREREIEGIAERLATARLVTLTGPGGTGKTRLALRVGTELLDRFDHGVWFVPLDGLADPELVPAAITAALGVSVPADRPPIDALTTWAAQRRLLIVLDNFEHLPGGERFVPTLLSAAPGARVLATSRTPLHVYGEHEYPVAPLPVDSEAVRLFVDRARSVMPDFALTETNAALIAQICARLDGLPLAIELAAARVKLLSPEQIATRLADSLTLLATTAADRPPRQRTLQAAIDWSFRLLSPEEQRLLTRLSTFRGGVALDAAADVAAHDLDGDSLDGLASLVDKSLLRAVDVPGETRFAMLETIRQRAAEVLASDYHEQAEAMRRHAAHFFVLAMESERHLTGSHQAAWLDRLEREHDNLRAAFGRVAEVGLLDAALMAAGAVWRFWHQRGHFAEARSIFDRLLASTGASPAARAKALGGAGGIAYWQGDYAAMAAAYSEASAIFESLSDDRGLAEALLNEAYVPFVRGDFAAGRRVAARARELFDRLGDELGMARAETALAVGLYFDDDFAGAGEHYQAAVDIFRRKGELLELADVLNNLAFVRALAGRWEEALAHIRESLSIFEAAGNEVGVAMALEGLAAVAAWQGDAARAARLFGYADATKGRLGGGPPPLMLRTSGYRDRVRAALGEQDFDRLYADGGSLSQAAALELCGFEVPPDTPPFPGVGGVRRSPRGSPSGETAETGGGMR